MNKIFDYSKKLFTIIRTHKLLPLWIFIFVFTFTGFMIHAFYLYQRYLDEPITNIIDVRSVPTKWPTVTICPTNRIDVDRLSAMENTPEFKQLTREYEKYKKIWSNINRHLSSQYRYEVTENLIYHSMYINRTIKTSEDLPFRKFQDILIQCSYAGRVCDFRHWKLFRHPIYFNCYSFTPPTYQYSGIEGQINGLLLVLHLGDENRSFFKKSDRSYAFRGFRVSIHEPGTIGNFDRKPINIETGRQTFIELSKRIIRYKNRNSFNCVEPDDSVNRILNLYQYNEDTCLNSEIQKKYWEICRCISIYNYPINKTQNDFTDLFNHGCLSLGQINKNLDKVIRMIKSNPSTSSRLKHNAFCRRYDMTIPLVLLKNHLNCTPLCNEVETTSNIHSSSWPNYVPDSKLVILNGMKRTRFYARLNKRNSKMLNYWYKYYIDLFKSDNETVKKIVQSRFSLIHIYLKNSKAEVIREELVYPWINLISDIGGAMGMWIGFSFLSVVQVVQFMYNFFNT